MLPTLSLLSLVLGATLAAAAADHPSRTVALETWGGVLLVMGLALLGAALPVYR